MKIGVIVQARHSSQRLPGKVLRPLCGKPLLQYLLESLQQCSGLSGLVVATSHRPDDDAVEQHCRQMGVDCFRGSLRNVVGRFRDVLLMQDWDAFVRLSGDSPLLDYRIVDHAVGIANRVKSDMVTNIFPRSFPRGQSVEVIRRESFLAAYEQIYLRDDLEHVTPYFYRNAKDFRIINFSAKENNSDISLAVDTPRDFRRVGSVLAGMQRPHWQYTFSKIVKAYRAAIGASGGKAA